MTLYPISDISQLVEVHKFYHHQYYNFWVSYSLYSITWWVLWGLFIFPWFIWWKLADRTRLLPTLFFGLLVLLFSNASDAIGVSHNLWVYPIKLFAKFPHLIPVDISVLPVTYMLVYQYAKSWSSFIRFCAILAFVLAFIGEPLAIWFGSYLPIKWEHIYSLPIYFIFPIVLRTLVDRIIKIQSDEINKVSYDKQ